MADSAPFNLRFANRIAYVVSHSYPYSSNGYATRTHAVARALGARGHEVIVINRPGRPWDIEGFANDRKVPSEQIIDGVRYVFLPSTSVPSDNRRTRLREAERVLFEAFEVFRPGIVMGVSNWENAEPAQNAARRFGAGFFYEQRGFWEMGRSKAEATPEEVEAARKDRAAEVAIARGALAVFTLNADMRREMANSGVPAEKIHLVPNGVSQSGIPVPGINRETLGITARYLLSYIGSLSSYEGVEDLVQLIARLREQGRDVAGMIVGSSAPKGLVDSQQSDPAEQRLRADADRLGISAHMHFVPQVTWDKVGGYYNMSDAIILPRRRSPMTELVSPIKPYAAATYSLPVYMTDMPPLRDVARDIHGSLFPEGDVAELADLLTPVFDGTHPAILEPLRPNVLWQRRVRPMSDLLAAETRRAQRDMDANMPRVSQGAGGMASGQRFDAAAIPQAALNPPTSRGSLVCIGPGAGLTADVLIHPNRQTLLADLSTTVPGTFVIDWVGLQNAAAGPGEWHGLWSIDNMRLNRQIMDATRIALDKGWRIHVLGPVHRSEAPLFRTIAEVVEEVNAPAPTAQATP